MKKTTTILLVILCLNSLGQNKRILSFNLSNGQVDTLEVTDYDTTIIQEYTNYYLGRINEELNILNEEVPTENVYPESNFTRKKQASLDYDINDFPIRTSVKLFKWVNDSLKSKCSGSMISRKHVFTACHCVASIGNDSLLYDSLFVSPVYDNGEFSQLYSGSWVKKIFLFENWDFTSDFSILELEEPIGENTGWISIGFDSHDTSLLDGIFYKFSYPATSVPQLDTNQYNGDTLYYGFGLADMVNNSTIGITNATGIPGESGSSLIKIKNETYYTSYGVLSFSINLRHCRLNNWTYFALKDIIKNDLNSNTYELESEDYISIYPNPTSDIIQISLADEFKSNTLSILNFQGELIRFQTNNTTEIKLNLSDLSAGIYILLIESNNNIAIRKLVKNGG